MIALGGWSSNEDDYSSIWYKMTKQLDLWTLIGRERQRDSEMRELAPPKEASPL